ncbi:MAG: hypothetical protein HKP58_00040 [Desulfatitalea sp.]|nr:phasin family protein [Desulfatitalea sp.]NNJ98778.1 hypothetical protein [Desulfatitalea sp.]
MPKKKGKSPSFDAMVKFFIHSYNIPTKRDIDALSIRLDRIERMLMAASSRKRGNEGKSTGKPAIATASDVVSDVIKHNPDGLGFSEIKLQTGYSEKKLRNILFRLNKLGRIKRKSRGIYISA